MLEKILYIHYLLYFQKDPQETRVLINLSSEINAMIFVYVAKLGFKVRKTNIVALKIDGSTFDTFRMVIANFQIKDKLGRVWFFQETFLIANTILEIIFKMLFLTFTNIDI